MLSALRANSTCGCLHATRLTSDLLNQATEALHTSVATATDKPAAANKTKSGAAAAASGVAAGASKDPMYCWLYPILYKPDQGWLYQMVPASADEKAAAAKVRTTTRSTQSASHGEGKQTASSQRQVLSSLPKKWPKPSITAYNVFARETIAEVKRTNPSKTFAEHSKILGQLWRAASEQVREECEKVASVDKMRYARELSALEEPVSPDTPEGTTPQLTTHASNIETNSKASSKSAPKAAPTTRHRAEKKATKSVGGDSKAMKRVATSV